MVQQSGPTSVFNPSGLHENTARKFGGSLEIANSVTTAYISRGDVLNFLQEYGVTVVDNYPFGEVTIKGPEAVGKKYLLEDAGEHSLKGFKEHFGITEKQDGTKTNG